MNSSIGRNDPCPCGSGLKYKKCCLLKPLGIDNHDEAAEILATAYKKLGEEKWEEALSLFQQALPHSKAPHVILEAVAACYDGLDDYLRAAEIYEQSLASCPQTRRSILTYRYGIAKARCKQWDDARKAFETVANLEENEDLYHLVDELLEMIEHIREGKKHENAFEVLIQLRRAFTEMDEDRFSDAVKRLELASELEPKNPTVLFNLGIAHTYLKQEDKALEKFQTCVDINPSAAEAYYNMGQIYLIIKKDFSRALSCFSRASSVKPDYVGAQHQKGKAYELLGYPEKALECWGKTVELDPGNKLAKDNIKRVRDLMSKADNKDTIE